MVDDLFTPEELALIRRLRSAPQPQLRPQAFQAIQQRILQATELPSGSGRPIQAGRTILLRLLFVIGLLVVVIVIVASVLAASRQKRSGEVPGTASMTLTPADSPEPTLPILNTAKPSATGTGGQPTLQKTVSPTFQPTAGPLPTTAPVAETQPPATAVRATPSEALVVVEGPVQKINNDIITVFDMDIRVDTTDPTLTLVQIGKTIRVEGYLDSDSQTPIIIAVTVSVVNNTLAVSPSLPPGCKVSKNGHIKCSKKK
jgi:hypothetical protein